MRSAFGFQSSGRGKQALAGLELGVVGHVEAELVDVEAEAAVLVADVDVDGVDAEVGDGEGEDEAPVDMREITRRGKGPKKFSF